MSKKIQLLFDQVEFDYDPYPIAKITNIFDPEIYQEMVDSFPDISLFSKMKDTKFSFNHRDSKYDELISQTKIWSDFNNYIQSREFVDSVFETLKKYSIDLGINNYILTPRGGNKKKLKKIYETLKSIKSPDEIETKFEFSALSADGGEVWPHTDSTKKLITFVVNITTGNDWNPAWGGGTNVLKLKDPTKVFDRTNNYKPDFDQVTELKTFDFVSNQCVMFIKTFNSWHSVMPMHNPGVKELRKTLTINVMKNN